MFYFIFIYLLDLLKWQQMRSIARATGCLRLTKKKCHGTPDFFLFSLAYLM